MAAPSLRLLAALVAALPGVAYACGACIEDNVAATYDHATVTKAAARGQLVVFGEIRGVADPQRVSGQIAGAASKVKGVARGTVHTSSAPPAFSFALDPHTQSPEAATAELQSRIATPGLRLTVIRVIR